MSRIVELPGGHSATLGEPGAVSERRRRPVTLALQGIRVRYPEVAEAARDAAAAGRPFVADTLDPEAMSALYDLNDCLVVALVESWSFPAPVSVEGLGDLPAGAYQALLAECAPSMGAMFVTAEPTPEQGTPTQP